MKFTFLILSLFFCFIAKSQDTIFYKKADKLVVVLKEITQTEIKYQKFDMQDGPVFIISKNDIEKIIYKNGYTEIMPPVVVNAQPQILYQSITAYKERLTYSDTKVKYKVLADLAHAHRDSKRQPGLSQLALSIKKLKPAQDGTRTGAIIFGALAVAGTAVYSVASLFGNTNDPTLIAPPIAFGVIAIALTSLSITFNIKLKQKRNAFVNLYNE